MNYIPKCKNKTIKPLEENIDIILVTSDGQLFLSYDTKAQATTIVKKR